MELPDCPTDLAAPIAEITELAPPDIDDPVVEAYKKHVDRALLIANLRLTPVERCQKFLNLMEMAYEKRCVTTGFRGSGVAEFPKANFRRVLDVFTRGGIRFIVVGGIAAMAHGRVEITKDVDIVYSRDSENIRRLVDLIAHFMAPQDLPFTWDKQTVQMGLNFTLTTSLGDLDLFGAMIGAGGYDQLLVHSLQMNLLGVKCRCVTLERMIQMKRAAGRPEDLPVMAELVALLEERRKMKLGESS